MDPYIGQIILWSASFAPVGWAFCDGSLLQIAQNQALFSIIGTTYGGDGRTTFGIPDLRGRVPVGVNSNNANLIVTRLGDKFGAENVKLSTSQLPMHTHQANASVDTSSLSVSVKGTPYNNGNATLSNPEANACLANGNTPGGDTPNIYNTSSATGNMASSIATINGSIAVNLQVQPAGTSDPVKMFQPSMALNYIIATEGIYPQRP
jgi:microcystin-dependent protein